MGNNMVIWKNSFVYQPLVFWIPEKYFMRASDKSTPPCTPSQAPARGSVGTRCHFDFWPYYKIYLTAIKWSTLWHLVCPSTLQTNNASLHNCTDVKYIIVFLWYLFIQTCICIDILNCICTDTDFHTSL